jgi:hypothetical protein
MAIVLSPQIEARLVERAMRAGRDVSEVADEIIASTLDREELATAKPGGKEQTDTSPVEASEDPAYDQFMAQLRAKYGFSEQWPFERTEADNQILDRVRKSRPEDAVGQQLHCRRTQGEALSEQDLIALQSWYDANDAEDLARMSSSSAPDLVDFRRQIDANRLRLDNLVSTIDLLAAGNAKIQSENAVLRGEIAASAKPR